MKNSAILLLILLFSCHAFGQEKKPVKKSALSSSVVTEIGNERLDFQKAVAKTNASERITALQKFLERFPNSESKTKALELIVSGRAELASEKLRLGETQSGIELFKLAVKDAPSPVSDELFTKVLIQFPTNLFYTNQPKAAIEVAKLIEEKIGGNVPQILSLASFYLGTENSFQAKRLAQKAAELEPNLPAAYQTLGLAYRMNFELEKSAEAYTKALELDNNSNISRRSLAEMKRATGKTAEAIALYQKILETDTSDANAQTGLILSLFDANQTTEAEIQLSKSLESNPNNLPLLVGAAYWYAASGQNAKTVELAERAVNIEPRYTWAHIALARGLIAQNRPLDAERVLLIAQRYGDFPTLTYQIAAARLAAGFYREAAEEIAKRFVIENGVIKSNLGGRVLIESDNFTDLLALERQASIFQPNSADNREQSAKLKSLLDLSQKLNAENTDEIQISEAVDNFVGGNDRMKFHRQIFAANRLLEKKKALPKAFELTKTAVGEVDSGLDAPNSSSAILADELYDTRRRAISSGEYLIVPEVPKKTLSQIARGRLEEIAGQILLEENQPGEATVRLKRAVSVLPENSSWWRSSLWKLGSSLDSEGKSEEALDAYIKSYNSEQPSQAKRIIIEIVYQKINGNLEGLDEKIGASPITADAGFVNNRTKSDSKIQPIETPASEVIVKNVENLNNAAKKPDSEKTVSAETLVNKQQINIATAEKNNVSANTEPKIIPENLPLKKIGEKLQSEMNNTSKVPETNKFSENAEAKIPAKENTKVQESSPNSLFESVVIEIPKTSKSEKINAEKNNSETIPKEKTEDQQPVSGASRARIVSTIAEKPTANGEIEPCSIFVSQEDISLIHNGGNLGIVVGFEDKSDSKIIKAKSNNPNDIKVFIEPDFQSLNKNSVVIIKSISENKGEFIVTFEAPCGRKDVIVKVR